MLIGMIGKAQQRDTIASVEININDTVVNCYHIDYSDTISYKNSFISKDRLKPELDNYTNQLIADYCGSDTLTVYQYQQDKGNERILVVTNKRRFAIEIKDLSPQIQYAIYLFSLKLKAIIKDEN